MDNGIIGIQQPLAIMIAAANDELISDLEAFISSKRETRLVGVVRRVQECLERINDWEPDVLLIEEGMGGTLAVETARSIKQKRPRTAVFTIVRESEYNNANYHRQLMNTHVSGVFPLTEPLSFQDWVQPMRDAADLLARIPEREEARFGGVIAIHSLKGGVGRTILAANMAAALATEDLAKGESSRNVILADLNWPFGGIETFLNLTPTRSVLDLLPVMDSLNRQNIVGATTATPGLNSLRVLSSPFGRDQTDFLKDIIEEAIFYAEYDGVADDLLSNTLEANLQIGSDPFDSARRDIMEHVLRKTKAKQALVQLTKRLLTSAPRFYEFVVIDLPPMLDENTLAVLRAADRILLMCTSDVPAIKALRAELDLLPNFGVSIDRLRLVLNKTEKRSEIRPNEVRALFPEYTWLPDLPKEKQLEPLVNTSQIAVLEEPKLPFSQSVRALSKQILDDRMQTLAKIPQKST